MGISDTMWNVFLRTGHIGAYLIYKDFQRIEDGTEVEQSEENGRFFD